MKKYIFIIMCLTLFLWGNESVWAQDWNFNLNPVPPNTTAYLGTSTNYPLRLFSYNTERMHINGTLTNNINAQGNMARNGFVGIGRSFTPNDWWNAGTGPFSLLHLNGDDGTFVQSLGYRNWMRNGITMTANNDMMFIGPRRNENDVTDAVISWSDNASSLNGHGPDNLVIAFTNGSGLGNPNDLTGAAPNGREIIRCIATGNVGIGPRFTNAAQPQSQLHVNAENAVPAWLQIGNQNSGQLATDGLRLGLNAGTAYLYNQENAPLVFATNANTDAQLTQERIRLTHIGAAGVPATAAANSTRLAVSLNPANALTQPRSLLHIGSPVTAGQADGTRDWMNVGYLATHNSDNVYVGLKEEGNDRMDAVIAWGDNQTALVNGSGPDNLRFIFASSQFVGTPGTPEAKSANGQEVGRFTPVGQFGIGNFAPGSPTPAIGATLDVAGDARIRTVQNNNALTQVLVRDPNDLGRVFWRDASTLGGNGTFGGTCGNAAAATLTQNTELPLGAFNLIFSGQHASASRVGIGTNCTPTAKLEISRTANTPNEANKTGLAVGNTDVSSPGAYMGVAYGSRTACTGQNRNNVGGYFNAQGSYSNLAIEAVANGTGTVNSVAVGNHAGAFRAMNGPGGNTGISGEAVTLFDGSHVNRGAHFSAGGMANGTNMGVTGTASGGDNSDVYGGYFSASGTLESTADVYGIYATAYPQHSTGMQLPNTWAGYFDGYVFATGNFQSSDQSIKNIGGHIKDAAETINRLKVYEYRYNDHARTFMQVDDQNHYGVIAQELEQELPSLVREAKFRSAPDSLGHSTENSIKSVNYTELVPILVAAFQEQSAQIEKLKSRLGECCSHTDATPTDKSAPAGTVIQTRLENADEPTLGQNVPNPFESLTRVPVYLPQRTGKAEIIFYGNDGKILQTLQVNERGHVWVDVDSEALASGIYSYTLFTDGRPVETRKMVKR